MPHDAAERTDDETPNRKQDGRRTPHMGRRRGYIAWCRMDPAIRRHVAMPHITDVPGIPDAPPSPDGRASHPAGPIRKGTP